PAKERLIDRTPFDQIVLNAANGGSTLEVLPMNLPSRPLAIVPAAGSIRVRLLSRPTEEVDVAWAGVQAGRGFEQIIADEALRLTTEGKFDEAYDYYARLGAEFPKFAGLNEAICNYLRANAMALYQQKQHDRALAILLTLYQRNAEYPALPSA